MKKATREKWLERVRAWRASGLTAQEFSKGKGFEASSLRWAVSRLGRDEGSDAMPGSTARSGMEASGTAPSRASRVTTSPSAPRLLPVQRLRPTEGSADVLVEIGAVRIRVSRGADIALIGEVVRAVQGGGR